MNVTGIALELHVAHNLLDINQASLGLELELGFLGNGELQVGLEVQQIRPWFQNNGGYVDAIAHLLDFETNFVGSLRTDDVHFGILPGFDLDAAIGHVVNHDDRPYRDAKLLFNTLSRASRAGGGCAPEKKSGAQNWQQASLYPRFRPGRGHPHRSKAHVSLCSFRAQSSRIVIRLFADRRRTSTRASARLAAVP